MIYKAIIAYDGSEYGGFQKQINALGIQEVIEKALSKIHKVPTSVTASGRTDAKVHALGQVIHFEGRENMDERGYYNALNTMLPKDVRVLSVHKAADDFHARFSSKAKHYDYVYTLEKDNPFIWRYKTPLKKQPDLQKLRQAASYLVGEHDFTAFSNAQIHPDKPRVKTIYRIDIVQQGDEIRFSYYGNGFLRYQVRMMTAAVMNAGLGKYPPEYVKEMLDSRDKELCRWNAPAQGLYLVKVYYEEDLTGVDFLA